MRNQDRSRRLVCPYCGNSDFTWTVEQVEFGDVSELQTADENPPRQTDRYDTGPVVSVNDDLLRCQGCDGSVTKEELVYEDEFEEDDDDE